MLKNLLQRIVGETKTSRRAHHIEDVEANYDNVTVWLHWVMIVGFMLLLCMLGMTCAWYADLTQKGF